jgi:hypothetical protein
MVSDFVRLADMYLADRVCYLNRRTISLPKAIYQLGLQSSTFKKDWKVFLIFFLAGTDRNAFANEEQKTCGWWWEQDHQGKPIPNFERLREYAYFIPHGDDDKSANDEDIDDSRKFKAALSLTEQLYQLSSPSAILLLSNKETVKLARRNCLELDEGFDWESNFCRKASACLAYVQRFGDVYQVPKAVTDNMRGFLLSRVLNDAVQTCIEGVVVQGAKNAARPKYDGWCSRSILADACCRGSHT